MLKILKISQGCILSGLMCGQSILRLKHAVNQCILRIPSDPPCIHMVMPDFQRYPKTIF